MSGADVTQAELLFLAAARGADEPQPVERLAPTGGRSALCPPECPHDFPDVNAAGWILDRVVGPPTYPAWCAEYVQTEEMKNAPVFCWMCGVQIRKTEDFSISIRPFVEDPTRSVLAPAHPTCAVEASRHHVTAMATFLVDQGVPDCSVCGRPYEEHDRPITTLFQAECAYNPDGTWRTGEDPTVYYRPSKPFRSKNWPYRTIIDSPYYTVDGKTAYLETEAEAIERLRQEALAARERRQEVA